MRTFLYLFLVFICYELAGENMSNEPIETFAKRIQILITSGSTEKLKEERCYPSDCVDDYKIEYLIGSEKKRSIISAFLNRLDLKIKISGPYQFRYFRRNSEKSGDIYYITYYDPEIVQFSADNVMTDKKNNVVTGEKKTEIWGKVFVETAVSPVESGWGFHYTPFYGETRFPWSVEGEEDEDDPG